MRTRLKWSLRIAGLSRIKAPRGAGVHNPPMPLEIELKLTCEPAVLARIGRHPAVRALKLGRARTEHLVSRYFDTPDAALRGAGLALRVRSTPRGWVQTLKGEGEGIAGLRARPEWEWPVPSQAVAGDLLAATPALKALGGKKKLGLALTSLAPRFETDFKRTIHALRFVDGTQAELCLDLGQLRARDRIEPICEAEIELRGTGGDSARLYALALSLVDSLPVRLGYLGKAARGHALSLRERSQPAPKSRLGRWSKPKTSISPGSRYCARLWRDWSPGNREAPKNSAYTPLTVSFSGAPDLPANLLRDAVRFCRLGVGAVDIICIHSCASSSATTTATLPQGSPPLPKRWPHSVR